MGLYQKFCEWGTDAKFVPHGKKCDLCGKNVGFLNTGFWSINAKRLNDGVICDRCYKKLELLSKFSSKWIPKELRKELPLSALTNGGWHALRVQDATSEPVTNQWERQYRFLLSTDVGREAEDALGSWTRTYTEVEGYVEENDRCSVVIFGSEEEGYWIWLEDQDSPEWGLEDARLHIVPAEDEGWLEGCPWVGVVDNDTLFSRRVALTENGDLVIQYYWELEGAPMVSYSYFKRG